MAVAVNGLLVLIPTVSQEAPLKIDQKCIISELFGCLSLSIYRTQKSPNRSNAVTNYYLSCYLDIWVYRRVETDILSLHLELRIWTAWSVGHVWLIKMKKLRSLHRYSFKLTLVKLKPILLIKKHFLRRIFSMVNAVHQVCFNKTKK